MLFVALRACLILAVLAVPLVAAPAGAQQAAGTRSLVDQVKAHSRFSTFADALEATRLADTLEEGGPYTVFAFTDAAFARLPQTFKDYLFSPAGNDTLEEVLGYHVIAGRSMSGDMFGRVYTVPTLDGNTLTIEGQMDFIRVNGATILEPDILARNGVIHLIDYVIIPPHF